MVQYNTWTVEENLRARYQLLIMRAVAGGMLSGKYKLLAKTGFLSMRTLRGESHANGPAIISRDDA